MADQAKIERLLKLMVLLSSGLKYTIKSIASKLGTSQRTAYRYIESLKSAGFIVNNEDGYWYIANNDTGKMLYNLLYFSEEEAYILSRAIHSIDENNMIKSNLVKKLYSIYDFDRVLEPIINKEHSANIHYLMDAIKQQKQVILVSYRSASSETVGDRKVEPYDFTANYQSVWCYDTEDHECKLFKISRIKNVIISKNYWEFDSKHETKHVDMFRMSSNTKIPVKVKLSLRAYNLMIEEYPLSEKFIIKKSDTEYLLDADVCSLEGIGRFALGLIDEIEIILPVELKDFIRRKVKKGNL